MKELVIVDSGGANLGSLRCAFERLGARAAVTRDARRIGAAARVVLPGVGAAGAAMQRLEALGLSGVLRGLAQPVLGICLGMQLLFARSAEGGTACLGVLPDAVTRLPDVPGLPVPHMGWNALQQLTPDPLLEGLRAGDYAYFAHSYAVAVNAATLACAHYGAPLAAVVRRGNFCGTQFHPERSGRTGARLLENFLRL